MKPIVVLLLCVSMPAYVYAQDSLTDLNLLRQSSHPVNAKQSSPFAPYHGFIAAEMAKTCVYEVRCGAFARGLYHTFGPIKASFLALDRIARCSHLTLIDTLPVSLNAAQKIKEQPSDYRLR